MRSSLGCRAAALAVAVSTAVSVWCAPSAAADDPPFIGWTTLVPALTYRYSPSSLDDCVSGRVRCVEKTIDEMDRRFTPLASACNHQAVFALAYLRTTEAYLEYAETPGFLDDPAFVNHEDAAFAQMYFNAYDDWAAGRITRVPPAWRIAFGAAGSGRVNGLGNLLLGMNAHVNRDLPFVLAGIGLTKPDGTSRKPDHDRINEVLNHVIGPLVDEEAATLDPQIPAVRTPLGVGYTALMQVLLVWRENAWRFAEQLVAAPTPAARDLVAADIESYAATTASALAAATSYAPPLTTARSRDQFCARQ